MTYAVDFDGTLCEDCYPFIGASKQEVIDFILAKKAGGHKLILWTCRKGSHLTAAVEWCRLRRITFDAVNENLPEHIALYGGDTRKIFADYYIDNKNLDLFDLRARRNWQEDLKEKKERI